MAPAHSRSRTQAVWLEPAKAVGHGRGGHGGSRRDHRAGGPDDVGFF